MDSTPLLGKKWMVSLPRAAEAKRDPLNPSLLLFDHQRPVFTLDFPPALPRRVPPGGQRVRWTIPIYLSERKIEIKIKRSRVIQYWEVHMSEIPAGVLDLSCHTVLFRYWFSVFTFLETWPLDSVGLYESVGIQTNYPHLAALKFLSTILFLFFLWDMRF